MLNMVCWMQGPSEHEGGLREKQLRLQKNEAKVSMFVCMAHVLHDTAGSEQRLRHLCCILPPCMQHGRVKCKQNTQKMGVCEKCSLGSTNEVAEQEAFESLSTKKVSEMGR